jgi:alanyl-tRNA synthetase
MAEYFTCHTDDLVEKTTRLAEENRGLSRELSRHQLEMIPSLAEKLSAEAKKAGDRPFVFAEPGGYDPKLAGQLANAVADKIAGVAAVATGNRIVLAVERSTGLHAGDIVKAFCEATGARGGGGPAQAQAGGLEPGRMAEYRAALERIIGAR